jgi:hypothetical protein
MKRLLAIAALVAALATPAGAADSLPSAMLGTWCTQPNDAQGTPMKRCVSATRWLVGHVCDSRPDRRYNWTFFRDGESLYLAQVGTFSLVEEPRRADRRDASGCFTSVYDKAHLAKHPDQLVTSMRLLLTDDLGFRFALRVTLRGRDDALSGVGWCETRKWGGYICHIEDVKDSGSVRVVPRGNGVLLYLDDRILMFAGDDSEYLSRGKDDDVFRLERVAERVCRGM